MMSLAEFGVISLVCMGATAVMMIFVLYCNKDKPRRKWCELCGEQITERTTRKDHIPSACPACGQLRGDGGVYYQQTGRP